jgi:hypothetical protein
MGEAYILVFIKNGANLAHFFRQMSMRKKRRKASTFLTLRLITGQVLTVYFADQELN